MEKRDHAGHIAFYVGGAIRQRRIGNPPKFSTKIFTDVVLDRDRAGQRAAAVGGGIDGGGALLIRGEVAVAVNGDNGRVGAAPLEHIIIAVPALQIQLAAGLGVVVLDLHRENAGVQLAGLIDVDYAAAARAAS